MIADLFQRLLNILQFVSMLAVTLFVLVLLPMSIIRKLRGLVSSATFGFSILWGVTLWVTATAVLLNRWGVLGFVLGVLLLGFGSLPLAAFASLLNGEWILAGVLLGLMLPRLRGAALCRLALVYHGIGCRSVGSFDRGRAFIDQITPDGRASAAFAKVLEAKASRGRALRVKCAGLGLFGLGLA